ncbi:MAG: DNA repair protein RadC [Candidatus Pacebacteria bacterium]|nr:DNA repair protein RadC [Candidatus Paceibacterota bacterium]
MQNKNKPQLREKLKRFGSKNLTDTELLAILLSTGTSKFSVQKTAHHLLQQYPLKKLHLQNLNELSKLKGIGLAKASKIITALELGRRNTLPTTDKITSPQSVLPYLRTIRHKKKEFALCLYLNALSEIIHSEIIALGGLNYILLEPRDILFPAVHLPATSFILAHNHPSNNPEPSLADKKTTQKLVEAGNLLGIELLDHLIVTKQAYFSFKEAGLLKT